MTSIPVSGIAIVICFALFCILSYKNYGTIAAAVLCAAIISLTCLSGFTTGFFSTFVTSTMNQGTRIFFSFFFGSVFGEVMNATGCANSLSNFCIKKFGVNSAPYIVMILSAVLTYVGVGSAMFICAYISFSLFRKANLPRTIACVALASAVPLVNAAPPGALANVNIVASSIIGTTLYAGGVIGAIAFVIGFVLIALWLRKMTRDAKRKGQGYVPFEGEVEDSVDRELPPVSIAFISLLMVPVLCMICNLGLGWGSIATVVTSLLIPTLFLLITCRRYMTAKISKVIDGAGRICLYPMIATCVVVGFSSVVTDTTAYNAIISALTSWQINPYIICAVGAAIIAALCADAIGGASAFLAMMSEPLVAMGANLGVIHRVCTLATSTFNSLPHASAVITALSVLHCNHKECYKDIAVVTIGVPVVYTIVGTLIAVIFF